MAHLRPWRALLLLDNCEHLLDATARLADAVLRGCPGVRVLATSRELLGLAGETAWRVPSLGLPPPDAAPGAAALEASGAGRLFLERARAAQPAFALTDANAGAVAEVCRRLDGIPLALELAAARVRVLTPEQLAARLGDRFRLLTGGGRTALRRQQTLQATVDWSHDLLSEPERALFRRLAVFPGGATGGFPLEAAEAVGPPGTRWRRPTSWTCSRGWWTGRWCWPRPARRRSATSCWRPCASTPRSGSCRRARRRRCATATWPGASPWARCRRGAGRTPAATRPTGGWPRSGRTSRRARLVRLRPRGGAPAASNCSPMWGQMGAWARRGGQFRRWLEQFLGLAPARTATRAWCLLALDDFLRWEHEFSPGAGAAAREARGLFEALGDADGAALAAVHEGLLSRPTGRRTTAGWP